MADPLLQAVDLSAGVIVRNVTLALPAGLAGLVGPNGSGKTTLLRALAGVAPHAGHLRVGGHDMATLQPGERARKVAYLPQIAPVSWPVEAAHLVALGRIPHGDGERATGQVAVARAMEATGTAAFAQRRVDTLSGGERARVLLARALAVEAPVLIADEPIAALDPRYQIETMQLLRRVADEGRLVIAAFHDLALAARYSDTLLVMHAGRLAGAGAPGEVLDDATIGAVFGLARAGSDRFGPVWERARRSD
ncbi:MAG: ABC transporter ATP-binding protein [Rhodobiaceae bacterium]|nr:ABC transporter ATP-binding protein [Rhodobiaceae bacterium]MCC0041937.1 ABC transporter ATP-binding protein [Rhodobiaceae bacterium]